MLERILVPLDGSGRAESVLAQLKPLLHRSDSEILLARVFEWPTPLRTYDPQLLLEGRREAKHYLARVEKGLTEQGARVRLIVVDGYPADALLAVIKEERPGMVVMTTHGRTGLPRFVMGSVAEKMVRASHVPVLVLRSFADGSVPAEARERTFSRILVPIDGSTDSLAALGPAIEWAKLYGSILQLAYVDESMLYPPIAYAGAAGMVAAAPPILPMYPSPEEALRPAAEVLDRAGVKHVKLAGAGDAAGQILDLAKQNSSDLIAMATHGRSGFTRWLLGSVTEKVLRGTRLPLLVVRAASRPPA